METVSPLAPLLLLSVYLKFEFYLRNISWNADIEKKKKKLSTRQQLRRSHVASSHLKGGKSALRNANMAKSPRHSRGTPRPLPSLVQVPNIPAATCGPLPGAGVSPREPEGGTAVRAKEEITESTVERFLLDHRTQPPGQQREDASFPPEV